MSIETLSRLKTISITRPLLSDIKFLQTNISKATLRQRRGRYIFELELKYFEEEDQKSIKTVIYVLPLAKEYFNTEQLILEEGENREEKLDQIKDGLGRITDESVFKEDLKAVKLLIIKALQKREHWKINIQNTSFNYRVADESGKQLATITIK